MSDGSRSSGGPPSFALTQAEREFLKNGSTGGYRKSKLESQIESKKESLPDRFTRLLEDADLLSEQIDEGVWEQFLIQSLPNTVSEGELSVTPSELKTTGQPLSPASELGRKLGKFINDIMYSQEIQDTEEVIAQISFGLILGSYIHPLPVAEIDEHGVGYFTDEINKLATSFASLVDTERTTFREMSNQMRESGRKWDEIEMDIEEKIRHVLFEADCLFDEDEHLLPDPVPKGRLFTPNDDNDTLSRWEKYRDSRSHEVVKKTMDYLIADAVEEEALTNFIDNSVPGSAGTVSIFRDSHDPGSFDVDEFASTKNVLDIYSEYRIWERIKLKDRLGDDATRLRNHQWRGVKAIQVLKIINAEKGHISSREISQHIDSRKNRVSQVTAIARALSGDSYQSQTDWSDLPLLSGDKLSWVLTEYGEVLAHFVFQDLSTFHPLSQMPKGLVNQGVDILPNDIHDS